MGCESSKIDVDCVDTWPNYTECMFEHGIVLNGTGTISYWVAVRLTVYGLLYSAVFVLGVLGNGLVIFVVKNFRRMHTVTNIFLASLSLMDLILVLLCVPVQYSKFVVFTWRLGLVGCYLIHFVVGFCQIGSILTLTVISMERYLAIVHPLKALWLRSVGRAYRTIVFIWITSAVLSFPNLIILKYEVSEGDQAAAWCFRTGNPHHLYGFSVYQLIVVMVIPLSTMIFCYGNVVKVLAEKDDLVSTAAHLSNAPIDSSGKFEQILRKTESKNNVKTKKQIIKMLLIVIVLFVFCWMPYVLSDLLTGMGVMCLESRTPLLKHIRMVTFFLAYINSCINPVVYTFMSKNFRDTFVNAWKRCSCRCSKKTAGEDDPRRMGMTRTPRASFSVHNKAYTALNTPTQPGTPVPCVAALDGTKSSNKKYETRDGFLAPTTGGACGMGKTFELPPGGLSPSPSLQTLEKTDLKKPRLSRGHVAKELFV